MKGELNGMLKDFYRMYEEFRMKITVKKSKRMVISIMSSTAQIKIVNEETEQLINTSD